MLHPRYSALPPDDYYLPADTVDGRAVPFEDHLFLLDEHGRVLGRRAALDRPALGDCFFEDFPLTDGELSEYRRSFYSYTENSCLMQSERTPLLALRSFCPRTQTVLIAIPRKEVGAILAKPAAYADSFDDHLTLSAASLARYARESAEHHRLCAAWILPIQHTLFFTGAGNNLAGTVTQVLVQRIARLALLCGARVSYDVIGLGFQPIPRVDYALLTGRLIAVFLLARRAAADRSLTLFVDREGPEAPLIHATLRLLDPADPLPEIALSRATAAQQGVLFAVTRAPDDPTLLHIRFTFRSAELSLQELRSDPSYRIEEEESPF